MILPFPLSTAGQAVANLYTAGAGIRASLYRRGWRQQQRLHSKVLSIGNISWGGTGKTPFTIWLAKRLSAAGLRPSILTRGYGRSSTEPVRFFLPGASAEDARTEGDEVQLYLRHGVNVPVGIASARAAAGRAIEERFRVDVHLLDDGFQHLSLARDLDIVLIDARNPWGARWGIPRVLRESPGALRRAHAILITNCGLSTDGRGQQLASTKEALKKLHPGAPQFLASSRILSFMDRNRRTNVSTEEMRGRRAVAFCGLGSPDNFFTALNQAGIQCVAQEVFHDHHTYSADDLKSMVALAQLSRADCLITTEKDLVNLPAAAELSIPLYWTEMQFEIEQETELVRWIAESLGFAINRLAASDLQAGVRGGLAVAAATESRSQ